MGDHLEGYCDGISGGIAQERQRAGSDAEWRDYMNGFWLGFDDRQVMLATQQDARWADGMGDGNG